MYSITIDDYENKKQWTLNPIAHYSKNLDRMEEMADSFILNVEGDKYFQKKKYRQPHEITKGYGLCREDHGFFTKICVYKKMPNGFIYNGDLVKIIEFTTIKWPDKKVINKRESEMYDEHYEDFKLVIKKIEETVELIDCE